MDDSELGVILGPVRVCNIAGHYLIFDPEGAAWLRRKGNANGVLVGTTPQQPTQNLFLGLPVELRPEEVDALLQCNAVYIVDDPAAHRTALQLPNVAARRIYIESLRRWKQIAQHDLAEKNFKKAVAMAGRIGLPEKRHSQKCANLDGAPGSRPSSKDTDNILGSCQGSDLLWGVTPTLSDVLIAFNKELTVVPEAEEGALCRFLLSSGYFLTPGLRFGVHYSVYPGDPLRFHAHFMANHYPWHEKIPVLDIVGGGRLATAVKKAFLIGGRQAVLESPNTSAVRNFSVEWAAM